MVTTSDNMPITVSFKKGLRTDGAIESVIVKQGDNEIRMTKEQAVSLASQVEKKLGQGC